MQKTLTNMPEIKLVGIKTRTNNANIFEQNPANNKIAAAVQKYFHNALMEKIVLRKKPGTTYCVYTDYVNDFNGDYTYFIGEEVTSFDAILPEGFTKLTIPAQNYVKFTNGPGPMPEVCMNMWQKIWQMTPTELSGERSYNADFEIYDERAMDHNSVELDIYVGIKR
jgi:predicted transcriptional regulator YdeE